MIVKNVELVAVSSGHGRSSKEIDLTHQASRKKCNELIIR
jgi:hypothetical protein